MKLFIKPTLTKTAKIVTVKAISKWFGATYSVSVKPVNNAFEVFFQETNFFLEEKLNILKKSRNSLKYENIISYSLQAK